MQKGHFKFPKWISLLTHILYTKALTCVNSDRWQKEISTLVTHTNSYFLPRFLEIPYNERILFLPYCLRGRNCPLEIDPHYGMICPAPKGCNICKLGDMVSLSRKLGYKATYIVVSGRLHKNIGIKRSKEFIMDKIAHINPLAVLGCLCAWDLKEKYLTLNNISPNGLPIHRHKGIIPQVVLLDTRNCRSSSVDWNMLEEKIKAIK